MPCDAACRKIIINTGFMATLAPMIEGPEAAALAAAARTHRDMLAALGYGLTHPDESRDFGGCEQAQLLVAWIADPSKADADTMNAWTAELWSQIAGLAAGKHPAG